jgi:LysR family transcriptional regulator, transcriptional activator of the cysJI operon
VTHSARVMSNLIQARTPLTSRERGSGSLDAGIRGMVLSCGDPFAQWAFSPFAQVPQVKVHIEYSRTDKVCEGCRTGLVDLGIVALPVRGTALVVTPWREEALVVVCAPDHPFGRKRRLSVAKLAGEAFIAFERDIPTRKTIDAMLKAHRVRVRTTMEFDNIETIKRSIEVGSGISILPEPTVVNEVRAGLLRTIPLAEGPLTRTLGVVHRRGRVLPAASAEFVRVLTSAP